MDTDGTILGVCGLGAVLSHPAGACVRGFGS